MSMMRPLTAAIGAVVGLTLSASATFAGGIYPTQSCVAAKLKAAAKKCQADMKAWGTWDGTQDMAARDMAIAAATTKLSTAFTKADVKASGKGVVCSETSLTGDEMSTAIDNAVGGIVTAINTGLSLPADGKCGAKLIKAAAGECAGFLKAEAGYFKKFGVDPTGTIRDAALGKVSTKFGPTFDTIATTCPTTATSSGVEGQNNALKDDAVTNTTTSPDLSTTWTQVTPAFSTPYLGTVLHPICAHSTPYSFFYKRGSGGDVNKLLVYYQGGGACWDSLTCSQPVYDPDVTASDNPANATTGFADPNNPSNPFRNWSSVFIAYCTGDVHWGNKTDGGIQHKGFINAKVVEKFAREHFVNPSEVFVTGSSAGAYGAILHGIYLHEVYLASTFNVMGDAGAGVITPEFRQTQENAWGIQANLPTYIGIGDPTQLTIADLYDDAAIYYGTTGVHHFAPRGSRFGQYSTAHDDVQTLFYNIMVNGILDFGSWWHSTCDWTRQALQLAADASSAAPNYKYYVGPGSRHTMWGTDRVYTETHGGVQLVVDWLNDMRLSPTWSNVACTDCSLLGSCTGGSNAGASCQHDSECPGGACNQTGSCNGGPNQGGSCQYDSDCPSSTCGNWADSRPDFKCSSGSVNAGASCQRDADCIAGTCQVEASFGVCAPTSTANANKLCSTDADCDGTVGSCVTEQPFQLDGIVSCPP